MQNSIQQLQFKKALSYVCGFLVFSLFTSYIIQILFVWLVQNNTDFMKSLTSPDAQLNFDFWIYLISGLVSIVSLGIPFFFLAKRMKLPIKEMFSKEKLKGAELSKGAFATLGGNFIFALISAALIQLLKNLNIESNSPSFDTPATIPGQVMLIICVCVIAPIIEEFVFRGVILQMLKPFGSKFALVFSAFAFSFLHGNLGQIPSAFLGGLVMGYIALKTDSLSIVMLIHFFNNAYSTAITYLRDAKIEIANNLISFFVIGCMVYFVIYVVKQKREAATIQTLYNVPKKLNIAVQSVLFWLFVLTYSYQFFQSFN